MMLEFTVGINVAGKHESAALKVKCERPDALINYGVVGDMASTSDARMRRVIEHLLCC